MIVWKYDDRSDTICSEQNLDLSEEGKLLGSVWKREQKHAIVVDLWLDWFNGWSCMDSGLDFLVTLLGKFLKMLIWGLILNS